jgi:hypothetical protein
MEIVKTYQVYVSKTKIGSSHNECNFEHCIKSKEDIYESKCVNTYNEQIQNFPITSFFVVEDYFLQII